MQLAMVVTFKTFLCNREVCVCGGGGRGAMAMEQNVYLTPANEVTEQSEVNHNTCEL
jgi:ribulose 1,5-bisphosphate synthetase/thiazole synthase